MFCFFSFSKNKINTNTKDGTNAKGKNNYEKLNEKFEKIKWNKWKSIYKLENGKNKKLACRKMLIPQNQRKHKHSELMTSDFCVIFFHIDVVRRLVQLIEPFHAVHRWAFFLSLSWCFRCLFQIYIYFAYATKVSSRFSWCQNEFHSICLLLFCVFLLSSIEHQHQTNNQKNRRKNETERQRDWEAHVQIVENYYAAWNVIYLLKTFTCAQACKMTHQTKIHRKCHFS